MQIWRRRRSSSSSSSSIQHPSGRMCFPHDNWSFVTNTLKHGRSGVATPVYRIMQMSPQSSGLHRNDKPIESTRNIIVTFAAVIPSHRLQFNWRWKIYFWKLSESFDGAESRLRPSSGSYPNFFTFTNDSNSNKNSFKISVYHLMDSTIQQFNLMKERNSVVISF